MTSFHASSWRGTARRGLSATAILVALAFTFPSTPVLAQTTPPVAAAERLSETTIKALQEALNAQGIAVKADGVLNEETRTAIRTYQSQHHLPVTGEPDRATLGKLGVAVRQSAVPSGQVPQGQPSPSTTGQAQMQPGPMQPGPMQPRQMPPSQMPPGPMQGPMMMNCPMMQAQMQGMMQMMQMMQGMMQMMQMQMQPPAPPPGPR